MDLVEKDESVPTELRLWLMFYLHRVKGVITLCPIKQSPAVHDATQPEDDSLRACSGDKNEILSWTSIEAWNESDRIVEEGWMGQKHFLAPSNSNARWYFTVAEFFTEWEEFVTDS